MPNNTVGLLILTAIALTLNHYITRFTATALTEWTVTKKEITIKWMEQIIFHKKADRTINWDEIKAYKLGSEKIFDRFKLILHDGTIVRIWHDNLITKDDFDSFISHFINRVELHNKAEEVKSLPQNGI